MKNLITARRRVLAGLCGLGLLPVSAVGQTTSAHRCAVKSATADGSEEMYAAAIGNSSADVRSYYGEYTFKKHKISVSAPMSEVPGTDPVATTNFHYSNPVGSAAAIRIIKFELRLSSIKFDGDWLDGIPPYVPVELAFDFSDGKPRRYPAQIKYNSTKDESYLSFDLADSSSDLTAMLEQWEDAKRLTIIVFGGVEGKTIAKIKPLRPKFDTMFKFMKQKFGDAVKELDTGKCPAPVAIPACYLTTATSEAVGLPDDCWELQTLRAFRDGPMMTELGATSLVEAYYAEAPAIVQSINARPDARKIWLSTYIRDILPSVLLVKLGLNRLALRKYTAMTRRLQAI